MRFYTNVQMVGDNFLVRGYEDGKHFATREKFYPTLFVDSKRKTKYKTLDGLPVEPIEPGTVRDCREFIKKYNEVENFNVYGNERFIYQYISSKYPEVEVKFDIEQIKLTTIDIEVKSELGFPDVESCAEEILLITLQDYTTKQIRTWGLVTEEETHIMGRKQISYDIGGVSQLDYLDLYKKFTYKAQESYRLDYIAKVEPVSYTHLTPADE